MWGTRERTGGRAQSARRGRGRGPLGQLRAPFAPTTLGHSRPTRGPHPSKHAGTARWGRGPAPAALSTPRASATLGTPVATGPLARPALPGASSLRTGRRRARRAARGHTRMRRGRSTSAHASHAMETPRLLSTAPRSPAAAARPGSRAPTAGPCAPSARRGATSRGRGRRTAPCARRGSTRPPWARRPTQCARGAPPTHTRSRVLAARLSAPPTGGTTCRARRSRSARRVPTRTRC
mmetsp:Transcript_9461/g.22111  ORF Transcript_9461/g.22111 Transcript_9461/m.22111 type:complete len:237 (-) Transcript_9461:675-1385(-)